MESTHRLDTPHAAWQHLPWAGEALEGVKVVGAWAVGVLVVEEAWVGVVLVVGTMSVDIPSRTEGFNSPTRAEQATTTS